MSAAPPPHAGAQPTLPDPLPRIVVSSVVRSAHQGESHGGVYLVDLRTEVADLVLDWNQTTISWDGRGGDRGLRGIAFHGEDVYLAASDEVYRFDREFRIRDSYRNEYLRHCHEVCVDGDRLLLTSTGFDSVLEFDMVAGRFVQGHCLRYRPLPRAVRTAGLWQHAKAWRYRPLPEYTAFDPNTPQGPAPADSTHLNSVSVAGGSIYASGAQLGHLLRVDRGRGMHSAARIPYGSHNAQPYDFGRILLNHTPTDRIWVTDTNGRAVEAYEIPAHDPQELEHAQLGSRTARPSFGRGLVPLGDEWLVGGSSPATVSLYRRGQAAPVRSVMLTHDVRNAIHGLAIWPFDG